MFETGPRPAPAASAAPASTPASPAAGPMCEMPPDGPMMSSVPPALTPAATPAAVQPAPGRVPGAEVLAPAGPAGPAAAPVPAPPDPAQMQAAANTLFRAMDGWGTDESAVTTALRGRSPAEIAEIRRIYADHFPGRTLDADVAEELGGNDLTEAQAALTANPVTASVAALRNASEGLGTNEDAIHATLRGITDPAVRQQVAAEYQRQTGESLDTMLAGELSSTELDVARAETTGDRATAAAARLDEAMNGGALGLGLGTDEDAIYTALEGCASPAEREALAAAYRTRTGRTLDADMAEEMGGADLDVASALATGDSARAAAARMQVAADGMGTDEDAIFRTLQTAATPQARQAIIDAYNANYGAARGGADFTSMIAGELGDMDATRATQLAANGRMDPAFALRYAMDGIGTDEQLIRDTLQGMSPTEIAAAREQYNRQYGGDLDAEIASENSGRDGFEIGQQMLGTPQTPQERIARMNAAYEFNRGSGAGAIGNFVMDNLAGSSAGQVLDQQHARIQELEGRLNAGEATPEDLARLQTIGDYQQQDVSNYQAVQDSATNTLATGATVAVGAVVTVATAGAASPAVIAALAALAGGSAGMAVKAGMLGASYSNEQIGIDAVTTIASAVTAGTLKADAVGQVLGQLAGVNPAGAQTLAEAIRLGAVSGTAGGLVNGSVAGALDERTWRGPGNGLTNFLTTAGTATVAGAASGAAGGAAGHLYNGATGVTPTSLNQGGQQATTAMGGLVGGAASGFGQTSAELGVAAARGQDVGSLDSIALRYGQSMAYGGIGGAADGYMTGVHERAARPATPPGAEAVEPLPPVATSEAAAAALQDAQAGVPATPENIAPLVEAAAVTPQVSEATTVAPPVGDAGPVEGRYDHPVYATDQSPTSPAHREHHELTGLASSADDFRFVLGEADAQGVTLSPERRAILEAAAAGGDVQAAQAALRVQGDGEALRDLHIEARRDGRVDPTEGSALQDWSREQGLDRMSYDEALTLHGFDAGEAQGVFTRANATDAAPSLDPFNDTGMHTSGGQTLATVGDGNPAGMSVSDRRALFDMHATMFGDLNTGTAGGPATTIRKAVNPTDAQTMANGGTPGRSPAMGGDVGPVRNTVDQGSGQVAGTLGLDYQHASNQFFNEGSNEWNGWVGADGIPVIESPLTQGIHDRMRMPLGTDATADFQAEIQARQAAGEFIPELMQTAPDGSLAHVVTRDRGSAVDPRTGWGMSASERAIDPNTGAVYDVSPNTETWMDGYEPMGPGSAVRIVNPDGTISTVADAVEDPTGAHPATWQRQ